MPFITLINTIVFFYRQMINVSKLLHEPKILIEDSPFTRISLKVLDVLLQILKKKKLLLIHKKEEKDIAMPSEWGADKRL